MKNYYKTELHAHTKPASSCSDIEPKHLAEIYKENGYDSVVVTNHLLYHTEDDAKGIVERYLEDYYKCCEAGKELGINVILGAELRFTENINDYLIYGICPDDLCDIYNMLPYGIDSFYREYKNDKNVIIQAHPFRDRMERAKAESLDGIEVFNMHPNHNSRIGFAAKYAREHNMIATCGSDFHHYGQECQCGILTQKPLESSYDVADVLKKREYTITIGGYTVMGAII